MNSYFTFDTLEEAKNYRLKNGLGGWIFEPENTDSQFYPFHQCILFPPEFTPHKIFNHPFTKGRSGFLLP